jgi:hypothetical protein
MHTSIVFSYRTHHDAIAQSACSAAIFKNDNKQGK